jgi:hypothetical protein
MRSRRARKVLLSLAVLVLALAVVEVVYRLQVFGTAGFSPVRLASVRTFGRTGFCQPAASHALRYELKPGLRGWYQLHPFETNSHGMRDREYTLEKPEGTFRIAVVGDSYAMGVGVPIEDAFHSVLERELGAQSSGTRYECLNFGVAGYHLLQYAHVIEEKALPFDPDLIVVAAISNDVPPPSLAYFESGPYRGVPEAPAFPFLRPTLLDGVLMRLVTGGPHDIDPDRAQEFRHRREELGRAAARREGEPDDPDQDYLRAVFARIARTAGVPVFFVYLGTSDSPQNRQSAAKIEACAQEQGFGFLDVCPLFRGHESSDYAIFPWEAHPNSAAHAIYATALERALRDGGWLGRQGF